MVEVKENGSKCFPVENDEVNGHEVNEKVSERNSEGFYEKNEDFISA
jgi:hypothetical protein